MAMTCGGCSGAVERVLVEAPSVATARVQPSGSVWMEVLTVGFERREVAARAAAAGFELEWASAAEQDPEQVIRERELRSLKRSLFNCGCEYSGHVCTFY